MRFRHLALLLASSFLPVGCSSAPAPAPHADTPPASPAKAATRLSGFWLVTVQRGGQSIDHSMHIALTEGELVGSITGPDGNGHELSKITLKEDKVAWEIAGQSMAQHFEGSIKGSSMEGTIKMTGGKRGDGQGGRGRGKGRGQSGDDGGRGGSAPQVTWKAFKSVEPPPEVTAAPSKPASAEHV